MADLRLRADPGGSLSTTTIIAIVSAIGVVILGLLAALVLLLIRAVRRHKQLLADLDERGLTTTQAQKEVKLNEVTRPRAVLRRNTILPYNAKSGWGALPSVETIGSAAPSGGPSTSAPEHYVPTKPIEPNKRTGSLSWPFHNRKLSGHSMKMKKLRANRLSAVLEDPKPSSLVPILGNGQMPGSRPPLGLLEECDSQPSSCQSLLQYHPAFRNQSQVEDETEPESLEASERLQRARSVTEAPLDTERPEIRQRSTSLHNQASGKAPDVILPPLPLDIARIKDEAGRKSQLHHVSTRTSISSFSSADSSILNPRPSPILMQTPHARAPKVTKREWKNNVIEKMNPLIETRESMYSLHGSMKSSAAEIETASPEARREFLEDSTALPKEPSTHTLGSVHTPGSVGSLKRAESITMSRVVSASASPSTARIRTPKRRSKTLVTSSGSPEKYCHIATNPRLTMKSPKRQTSRASSRSSCGNPFQWDPAPLTSVGRPPSALKGSPGARQGHRRGHSVRISLVPTVHSIRNRAPSSALIVEDEKSFAEKAVENRPTGLGVSTTRSLPAPAPPTSEMFAPELSSTATPLKALSNPTTTSLSLVNYDQTSVVAPTDQVLPGLSDREQKRLSTGSVFSLCHLPLPLSLIESDDDTVIHVPDHKLVLPMPDTPYLQQYPFRIGTPDRQSSPSQMSLIDLDEYDPDQLGLASRTFANVLPRTYQPACTTILEETSVGSKGALDHESNRYGDSPPVSPKTSSPPRFTLNSQYNLPVHATTIPEEEFPETIDPSVLTKDDFSIFNSGLGYSRDSIAQSANSSRTSIVVPTTPGLLAPLLSVTLPSPRGMDSPTIRSQTSSIYSSPSHSRHASVSDIGFHAPCSPRPAHASLPTLPISFTDMPNLHPGLRGSRVSRPKPLRLSIQQLRRMNSDAADARKDKAGHGERRYLRLGFESSVQPPGEESWFDELDGYEAQGIELEDEEVRRFVGKVLENWDEEGDEQNHTVLDPDETPRAAKALGGARGIPEDTIAGAEQSSSSIWDESDAFWTGLTPPPESKSEAKPAAKSISSLEKADKEWQFEVAKDELRIPQESPTSGKPRSGKMKRDSYEVKNDRKRSVLGDGTPNVNVKTQATNPTITPGNYYDAQGFLRV